MNEVRVLFLFCSKPALIPETQLLPCKNAAGVCDLIIFKISCLCDIFSLFLSSSCGKSNCGGFH